MELPSSPACERNKDAILARLKFLFSHATRVLEIGSGTGQHGVQFAANMPWLQWSCSDREEYHVVLRARIERAALENLYGPIRLDVMGEWPADSFDAVFSANTAHIMPWIAVEKMFDGAGKALACGGRFALYGPFHYSNTATSRGNAAFDHELQARGNGEGVRDIDAVNHLAALQQLQLVADFAMPANNRMLAWEKCA